MSIRRPASLACSLALTGLGLPAAQAQQGTPPAPTAAPRPSSAIPQRETLLKLSRPISVDLQDKRLEDVIAFIQTSSTANIEPMWIDDRNPDGLDKEKVISVKVDNVTFLSLIEKVLDKARGDAGENTWQMAEDGAIQIGTKERLNKFRRVEIYDINDLLLEIPDYTDIPQIDLQQALQASQGGGGGGGGGQSPFRETGNNDRQQKLKSRKDKSDEIQQLIQSLVEPEQWVDNGGSGATCRQYQGSLIINAPDYVHRGINGYRYWPSSATSVSMVEGRRYVTLNADTGISKLNGFRQTPVTAVVGGRLVPSGPGGR